jgi:hypothetical protein
MNGQTKDLGCQRWRVPQPEGIGAIIKTIGIVGSEPAQLPVD